MEPKRYDFGAVFSYNQAVLSITPKFDVVINNRRYPQGSPIFMSLDTLSDGLNLFNYIGRDIAGRWDPDRKELNILGFY